MGFYTKNYHHRRQLGNEGASVDVHHELREKERIILASMSFRSWNREIGKGDISTMDEDDQWRLVYRYLNDGMRNGLSSYEQDTLLGQGFDSYLRVKKGQRTDLKTELKRYNQYRRNDDPAMYEFWRKKHPHQRLPDNSDLYQQARNEMAAESRSPPEWIDDTQAKTFNDPAFQDWYKQHFPGKDPYTDAQISTAIDRYKFPHHTQFGDPTKGEPAIPEKKHHKPRIPVPTPSKESGKESDPVGKQSNPAGKESDPPHRKPRLPVPQSKTTVEIEWSTPGRLFQAWVANNKNLNRSDSSMYQEWINNIPQRGEDPNFQERWLEYQKAWVNQLNRTNVAPDDVMSRTQEYSRFLNIVEEQRPGWRQMVEDYGGEQAFYSQNSPVQRYTYYKNWLKLQGSTTGKQDSKGKQGSTTGKQGSTTGKQGSTTGKQGSTTGKQGSASTQPSKGKKPLPGGKPSSKGSSGKQSNPSGKKNDPLKGKDGGSTVQIFLFDGFI